MITEKQRKLLRDLTYQREIPLRYRTLILDVIDANTNITSREAHALIDIMLAASRVHA